MVIGIRNISKITTNKVGLRFNYIMTKQPTSSSIQCFPKFSSFAIGICQPMHPPTSFVYFFDLVRISSLLTIELPTQSFAASMGV